MSVTLERRNALAGRGALRALVVDDNEPDFVMIERMLRERFGRDIEVRQVDTADEAAETLAHEAFDVALIDYRLPDRTGLELVAELASRESAPAMILLSGQGSESVAAQAIKRGAKDYLVKQDLTAVGLGRVIGEALDGPSGVRQGRASFEKLRRDHAELGHGVRSLSHDMTATFMVLQNSFERLRNSADDRRMADLSEGMSHVDACLRQSSQFLDDLAALAKNGSVEMEPERIELSRVVEEVRYELAPILAERGVELEASDNLPVVWCHETRVKQIISNLVRNAVRHGCDEHAPRIVVRQTAWSTQNGYVWIRVYDNGPGIPVAQREAVFLPGRRLNLKQPGSGLGLAIVKKIVTHYGGTVFVDPACDRGAAIIFSLPAADSMRQA